MAQEFEYMLLNRLQSDCYSFIEHGGKLWGITPKEHMNKMFELWDKLKIKPEWLTKQELKNLNLKLTKEERNF